MNLYLPGKPVDVLHTGSWTAKAIEELKKLAEYRLAASTESDKFTRVPRRMKSSFAPNASYVHICTNNTIEGTQWSEIPDTGAAPLVADMSSDIASRPHRCEAVRADFCGGAEEPWAFGRDDCHHAARSGRARGAIRSPRFCNTDAHQGAFALQHAADLCGVHRGAGGRLDRGRGRACGNRETQRQQRPRSSMPRSMEAAAIIAALWKRARGRR